MKPNMGDADRAVRVVAAVLIGVFFLLGVIKGTLALVLGIVAAILVATAVFQFCPIYALFGRKPIK